VFLFQSRSDDKDNSRELCLCRISLTFAGEISRNSRAISCENEICFLWFLNISQLDRSLPRCRKSEAQQIHSFYEFSWTLRHCRASSHLWFDGCTPRLLTISSTIVVDLSSSLSLCVRARLVKLFYVALCKNTTRYPRRSSVSSSAKATTWMQRKSSKWFNWSFRGWVILYADELYHTRLRFLP